MAGPAQASPSTRAASYTSCSAAQQAVLVTATADAATYVDKAVAYFAGPGPYGARYTTWFGENDAGRSTTVKNHFTAMKTALATATIAFNCAGAGADCTVNVVAYVNPADAGPYTINLCSGFWNQPATGTDSRAGTLVHELSHFAGIGGTVDKIGGVDQYGQLKIKALAALHPADAITVADAHEYFAENNAALEASSFEFSADRILFGDVEVGATAFSPITLTSTGDQPLVVSSLAVSGGFVLSADTCSGATLAPNATCTFTVSIAPTAPGAFSGTVAVAGSMFMRLPDLQLSGTGVAAPVEAVDPGPRATTVAVRVRGRSVVVVLEPSGTTRRFTIQRRTGSKWRALPKAYTATGSRTITLPRGTYRVVVAAATGLRAATSARFTIRR